MLFTQLEFPIFFLLVLVAAWLCRERITRNSILLTASYYFYAYWDYRFCGLLILSTVVPTWPIFRGHAVRVVLQGAPQPS